MIIPNIQLNLYTLFQLVVKQPVIFTCQLLCGFVYLYNTIIVYFITFKIIVLTIMAS